MNRQDVKQDGGSPGVLLLHGFTGSPAELSWFQEQFEQEGFVTELPTLCGHGRTPEALLQCTFRDWIDDAETALRALRQRCETVFVVGLSMGGALALHLAANFDFAAVATLAAPVKLSLFTELAARLLHPVLPWRQKPTGPDIRDREALKQLQSYWRYPTRAAVELFRLLRLVREELPRIRMPILIVHSRRDHSVPVANAQYIYSRVRSQRKKIRLFEKSYHIISADVEKEQIFEETRNFFNSLLKEKHV